MKMIKTILTLCTFALITNIPKCRGSGLLRGICHSQSACVWLFEGLTYNQRLELANAHINMDILWGTVALVVKRAKLLADVELSCGMTKAVKRTLKKADMGWGVLKEHQFAKLKAVLLAVLNNGVGLTEALEGMEHILPKNSDQSLALKKYGIDSKLESTLSAWDLESEDDKKDMKMLTEALKEELTKELKKTRPPKPKVAAEPNGEDGKVGGDDNE